MPLGQQLSLLPITDALSDAVAYLEAEYFGGASSETAQVWDGGHVVLGPLHLAENEPPPADGSPISQALRRLGVDKRDHHDEFDAVGLGRFRETDDWLDHPN